MKMHVLGTVAAIAIATPAVAQTTAPEAPAPTAPATSAPGTTGAMPSADGTQASGMGGTASGGGMTMGTTSTVAVRFVELSPADIMSSQLEDLDVYNNDNENIGEIEDLVIRDGRTVTGVVVSVGGFLGIGDRYVLLDPSSVVLHDQDGDMRALVNTSKDELTNAPEFEYTDEDD